MDGDDFAQAVAWLAGGELRFPPPFDLATSIALLRNDETGDLALKLFDACSRRSGYLKIQVHEVSIDDPEIPDREIIDGVFTPPMAIALFAGLFYELYQRSTEETGVDAQP